MHAEQERIRSYCDGLFADPSLDPIKGKIGLRNDEETTFEMLTDTSKPTDVEKAALVVWAKKKEDCIRQDIAGMRRSSVSNSLIVLTESMFQRFQFLIADLHNNAFTYGEFSRKRRELNDEYRTKKENIRQLLARESEDARYRAELLAIEASKAAAFAQRAASERYANQLRQMEMQKSVTCTTYYNMITCQ